MARRKLSPEEVKSIKNLMVSSMRKSKIFVPYGVAGKTKLPRTPNDIPQSMVTYKNKIYMAAYKMHWKNNSKAVSAQPDYVVGTKHVVAPVNKQKARTTRVAKPDTSQPVIITYSNGTVVNINPNGPITVNFKTT
tara:strand:- start:210 stop:614 length:405 start_codon:yes stop_codon:yes gene_type:complete